MEIFGEILGHFGPTPFTFHFSLFTFPIHLSLSPFPFTFPHLSFFTFHLSTILAHKMRCKITKKFSYMQIQNACRVIFLPFRPPFSAILAVLQVLLFAKSGIHPQIKYVISILTTLAITDLFTTSYSVHQLVDHQVVNF